MLNRRDMLTASLVTAGAASLVGGAASATTDTDMNRIGAREPLPPPPGIEGLELRHAFSLTIFFKERIRIRSDGTRVFVPVIGGDIWGPRLQGKVVPYGGADYAGGGRLDASYMLQADDGALIYINNRGYMKRMDGSRENRAASGPRPRGQVPDQNFHAPPDSDVPLRMRLAPLFDAPRGRHDWLNNTLIVGHGGRYTNPDYTLFTYYEVL